MAAAKSLRATETALRKFALGLPGAKEEFPWGESVVKVNKKIFVFFGVKKNVGDKLFLGVKLPHSAMDVLDHPFAKPTGYGLGKSGWVSMTFEKGASRPPEAMMRSWIEESYCAVAPKKLAKALAEAKKN